MICAAWFFFGSAALDFSAELKRSSYRSRSQGGRNGVDAACIEYFDFYSLEMLRCKHTRLPAGRKAAVYFEQDTRDDSPEPLIGVYAALFERLGILPEDVWLAMSPRDKEVLTAIRYDLPVLVNERVRSNGWPLSTL